jgi:hypothetical protein
VAIVEQRHMPLKKLVTKEANLYQGHLLSKKFIKEATEPQKKPLMNSSFLASR